MHPRIHSLPQRAKWHPKRIRSGNSPIEIYGLRVLIHGNSETSVPVPEIEAMIEKSGGDIATAQGIQQLQGVRVSDRDV